MTNLLIAFPSSSIRCSRYSLMPVEAMPWMNIRWKKKNSSSIGSIASADIAITSL